MMRPLPRTGPIARANRWYDRQGETTQVLLVLAIIGLVLPVLTIVAPPWGGVLVAALGLPRVWWITRGNRR